MDRCRIDDLICWEAGISMVPVNLCKEILMAEKISLLFWDLETDCVEAELLTEELMASSFSETRYTDFLLHRMAVHPDDRKSFTELIRFLEQPQEEYADGVRDFLIDYRLGSEDAGYQWFHARYRVFFEGDRPRRVVIFLRNTEEEHQQRKALQRKAGRDSLTGLFNKGRAGELIDRELGRPRAERVLLAIDLDGFKAVNDTLGHLFGDAVLSDMAISLTEIFHKKDILGRIGGDEFVALLHDVPDRSRIVSLCETIRNQLRRSFDCGNGKTISVSGSLGIALAPEHGRTFGELFEHADAALYEAKRRGRDTQAFYTPELQQSRRMIAEDCGAVMEREELLAHPVEFIFRMLYETRNARVTVHTLLKLFAKYFRVQRVVIYQNLSGNWSCWFEWHADGVLPAMEAHAGEVTDFINANYEKGVYGYFTECSDTSLLEGSISKTFAQRGIVSFLHAGIMNNGTRIGCVGFDNCRVPRAWTKKEHEILKSFADILGTFLMDQMKYNMAHKGYQRIRKVLDALPRPIWVVAEDDGRMLYLNGGARALFEESVADCHRVRTRSNRPCSRCRFGDLGGRCPVCLGLKQHAETRGLSPILVDWGDDLKGCLYADVGSAAAEGEDS